MKTATAGPPRAATAHDVERPPFRVADLSLAEWGRDEIRLPSTRCPG